MAKVTSPLLSLGATGKIAKSLVFSSWKGIADVRQYVVPANPRSTGQVAQRGLMTAAVEAWHGFARNAYDVMALAIWAALEAKPMSGFNKFVKAHIAAEAAEETAVPAHTFTITTNAGGVLEGSITLVTGLSVDMSVGLKSTVLPDSYDLAEVGSSGVYNFSVSGLTEGVDYFIQFTTATAATQLMSGIYKVRTLAA